MICFCAVKEEEERRESNCSHRAHLSNPSPLLRVLGLRIPWLRGGRVGGTLELKPPPPTAAAAAPMGDVQVDVVPENCRVVRYELLLNSGHNFICDGGGRGKKKYIHL